MFVYVSLWWTVLDLHVQSYSTVCHLGAGTLDLKLYCQCSGSCRILMINQEFHSRKKIVYIVRFHPLLNSVLCWPVGMGSAELFMLLLHCRV